MKINKLLLLIFLSFQFVVYIKAQDTLSINKPISIIGVGDVMLGSGYPEGNLPPKNECSPLLENVKNLLIDADLTIGNLEGCFSDTAPRVKYCSDSTHCFAFRMPTKYAQCIKYAGFDVMTIANNHSGDFGDLGRQTTVNLLDSMGIHYAGWIKHPTAIFKKDSLTYGICSFAPNNGTVNLNDIPNAISLVKNLAGKCDIVIVTFHGGAEGKDFQHVTRQTEEFYGENRGNVYEFAHAVIDAGADLVIGSGPHVARAFELYNNRFIAYSLGNFCTYGRFNLSGPNGIAPIVKVNLLPDGQFIDGVLYSAKQPGQGGTIPDPDNKAIKTIQVLTKTDFPESELQIDDDGYIHKTP